MRIGILLLSLFMVSASFAGVEEQDDYRCDGLANIEEYRVGINLKTKEAWFFDNDMNSYMQLTSVQTLETAPPQMVMMFEGEDLGAPGRLSLTFNLTLEKIELISVKPDGTVKPIGAVSCERQD